MDTVRVHPGEADQTDDTQPLGQARLCACLEGWVFLGRITLDEEIGEEVERIEAVPCRRCAEVRS